MSLEIDWDKIVNDTGLNEQIVGFLNSHIQDLQLPSYLSQLNISNFSLGDIPPIITIRHIGNPFKEFYQPGEELDETLDIQFVVDLDFKSDIYLELETNLLLNYPSTNFISLPIKLKFTELCIHSLAAISLINKKLFVSFLCDVDDDITATTEEDISPVVATPDVPTTRSNSYMGSVPLSYNSSLLNFTASSANTNFLSQNLNNNQNNNRIDIIKKLKIESELGKTTNVDGSILRNIGKIEKFLIEMLKDVIITELAWPSWLELDFNEDNDDDDDDETEL